jgi:hypothetical protein
MNKNLEVALGVKRKQKTYFLMIWEIGAGPKASFQLAGFSVTSF